MLTWLIFSMCCSFFVVTFRRKVIKRIQEHENPKVQGLDRIPIHTPLIGFVSEIDARNFVQQPKCSGYVQYLDGEWYFYLHQSFQQALTMIGRGIQATTTSFVRCSVPCQWQLLQSGDTPTSTHLPCENMFSENPAGYFQYTFEIPIEWERRQIRLYFGAVGSAYYVWINGHFVGFSKDSRLSAEYNITQYSKFGRPNNLEIIVVKYSESSQLENHGAWRFSGIFREVYVMSLPQAVHIQDFNWIYKPDTHSEIEGKIRKVSLTVKIQLEWDAPALSESLHNQRHDFTHFQGGVYPRSNFLNSSAEWFVSTALYEEGVLMSSTPTESFESAQYFAFDNPKSQPLAKVHEYIFRPSASSHEKFLDQSREDRNLDDEPTSFSFTTLTQESSSISKWVSEITHRLVVKSPKQWSTEHPYIYTLVIVLRNAADGKIVQAESCRVAFRTVDVSDGLLRINSKPILIRGINLLEFDSQNGYSVPRSLCELDIQLMKRNNINAIRTPPHDPWLYELCSLYGIYVINEVNIQPHFDSLKKLVDDPDWEEAYLTRLIRLYGRDKTHPCIIIWSLGNRSGYGKIHDKMANWVRMTDPTRLVMYEPASYGPRPISGLPIQNRVLATDVLCPMYAQVPELIALANRFPDHPLILSEYSLMTGNGGGHIEEYWNSFNTYRRLQGGFLCNWTDHDFGQHPTMIFTWRNLVNPNLNDSKANNSLLFSGLNWHDRGQRKDFPVIDDSHNILVPHGLLAQLPHSGFARERELLEMSRIRVKPELLEAKQCMKFFDCHIVETKFSEEVDTSMFLVSTKILISNLTDHLEDLSELLTFESFLLCNGAMISVCPFLQHSSSIIRHLGDDAGGREDFQQLAGHCQFTIPTDKTKDGKAISGIPWPEDVLSIPTSLQSLLDKIAHPATTRISVDLGPLNDWKVVVLSRLAQPMSWGSAGLPMGFKQLKLERLERFRWDHIQPAESDDSEKYQVTIKWIQAALEVEPNILIRAESLQNETHLVEAIISSKTGYLSQFRVDGTDILHDDASSTNFLPSRFQIHRAPTAIDQKGYSSAWKVAGVDKEMHHVAKGAHHSPVIGTEVIGHTSLRMINVDRIYLHQRDDVETLSSSDQGSFGEGILCTWEMTPDSIDRGKILILDKIQKFVNDSSVRAIIIEVRSNQQEAFLIQLASIFRLGREVMLTKEEKLERELAADWNTPEPFDHVPKEFLKIRLWKLSSIPSSSIPYVEAQISTATGSLKYDEIDADDGYHHLSHAYYDAIDEVESNPLDSSLDFNCRKHYTVKWSVSYILDTRGNLLIRGDVDISSLPCPPARIGLQLNVKKEFQSCSWLGNGPHENYLDRKASSVCAIHSATCDSLHVPYSVPGENGGRSNVQWIEFACEDFLRRPSKLKIRCNPVCNFSAQNYSTEDLIISPHESNLNQLSTEYLCVNIDPYLMGLGCDDNWCVSITDQYLLPPKDYNFQFVISVS